MYRLINIVGTAKNFFAPDRTISLNKKCIPLYPYIKSIFLKMPCKQIHLPIYLLDRISYRFGKSVAIRIGFAFYPSIIICLAIDCARVVFHFNDENSILVYDDIIKLSFSPIIRNINICQKNVPITQNSPDYVYCNIFSLTCLLYTSPSPRD